MAGEGLIALTNQWKDSFVLRIIHKWCHSREGGGGTKMKIWENFLGISPDVIATLPWLYWPVGLILQLAKVHFVSKIMK